jgi:Domain of unknown function (DUF1707).
VDEDSTRASDDERERAALELREHLVAGRLTLEEFSERVELAYRASTVSDLEAAGSALPVAAGGGGCSARSARRSASLRTSSGAGG